MTEREQFETWYLADVGVDTHGLKRREDAPDVYESYTVDRMWMAWLASANREAFK